MNAHAFTSDVAFTPTVKAIQARKGSRVAYARVEERGGWQADITADLAAFIEAQTSVFLSTANGDGQPYIQHRGGPAGFLKVLDERTIGFTDFSGNRQFITQGNLDDNPRAFLFLIDYAHRQRIKIWGSARVVEDDAELMAKLMPEGYKARPDKSSCSRFRLGTPIARSIFRNGSKLPTSRRRWPSGTSVSNVSNRRSRACAAPHAPRSRNDIGQFGAAASASAMPVGVGFTGTMPRASASRYLLYSVNSTRSALGLVSQPPLPRLLLTTG